MKNIGIYIAAAAALYFIYRQRQNKPVTGTTNIATPTGNLAVNIPRGAVVTAAGSAPVVGTSTVTLADDYVKPFTAQSTPVTTPGVSTIDAFTIMNGY